MNAQQQQGARRNASHRTTKIWLAVFLLIAVLVYSPWIAPYGKYEPFILGLPFTVFWWMFLSLVLLVSILLFVIFVWREDKDKQGRGEN